MLYYTIHIFDCEPLFWPVLQYLPEQLATLLGVCGRPWCKGYIYIFIYLFPIEAILQSCRQCNKPDTVHSVHVNPFEF